MYEELIRSCRACATGYEGNCDNCMFSGEDCYKQLHKASADVIEELSSQLEDFKRLCLPLKENRLYKFADGSFTEVTLMIVPREPTEPQKEEGEDDV